MRIEFSIRILNLIFKESEYFSEDVWACCCESDNCNDEIHSPRDIRIIAHRKRQRQMERDWGELQRRLYEDEEEDEDEEFRLRPLHYWMMGIGSVILMIVTLSLRCFLRHRFRRKRRREWTSEEIEMLCYSNLEGMLFTIRTSRNLFHKKIPVTIAFLV